ncbi:MAG TPA: TonB-dependent receptor [Woeseiaceae bacterium]|nr:TonB-dependent receptor [Woeseiaceae bacterium]
MKHKRSIGGIRAAVRYALGAGAGTLALGLAPAVQAQDDDSAAAQLEEITVTGSRIKRADLDSASPVTVLDREDIMAQGITDVGNLIQRMPSMSGTPLGTTTNNGNTEEGTVQIDLRGMGVERTVTLINGKRTVDGGDFTTIPSIMIERVEILKDGASAIYGADAVAGVVNIITRTDFDGVNIDVQTSDHFDMDSGAQNAISLIAGTGFDRGNFVFGAEYIDQEQAYQSDAPWDYFQGAYYIYYETDFGCESDPTTCTFFGSSRLPEGRLQFADGNIYMVAEPGAVMTPYDGRTYNYAPVNFIQTPYNRTNVFGEGNFDVSDNVRFTAAIRGSSRRSDQELAPLPYDTNIDPGYEGVFNGNPYTGVSPDNYYLRDAIDRYNTANGTSLGYEPVTNARRRMTETPRHYSQDLSQYQALLGFEGEYSGLDWEVYYNRGYRSLVNNDLGQFSGERLQNALGPSADLDGDGTPECYGDISDPSTLVTGCVPLNLFGGEGTVSEAMLGYVGVELVDTRVWEQDIVEASVSGSAFELPGGELGWAVGAGYRGDAFKYTPDSAKVLGAATGGTGAGTDGSLYSTSVYGEVYAPVFDNGTQSLALKGGTRWDDYNLFGDDTTWQVGVEFQVIDSLKLRGTAGTAFRAPTIEELFDGLQDDAPTYIDPCDPGDFQANYGGNGTNIAPGCGAIANRTDSQTTALIGGSTELTPETAETFTAGLVWTPGFGEGDLSVTVDWWQIDLEDAITTYGVQFTLDECYVNQVAESCALITRRNDFDYTIRDIVDTNVNVASQVGEGIDTEIRYAFDTDFGTFDTALLWSHLLDRSRTPYPGAPEEEMLGYHFLNSSTQDGGTYAEDKWNASVHWSYGDLSVGYMAEFIGEIEAFATFQTSYTQQIDSQLYHDLVFDYRLDIVGDTMLTLGITNLSNEEPPYIDRAFNASTDPSTYRMFGRGYFFRLSQTF